MVLEMIQKPSLTSSTAAAFSAWRRSTWAFSWTHQRNDTYRSALEVANAGKDWKRRNSVSSSELDMQGHLQVNAWIGTRNTYLRDWSMFTLLDWQRPST
jgi:hypothetical protein